MLLIEHLKKFLDIIFCFHSHYIVNSQSFFLFIFTDPTLLTDQRVLDNVLSGCHGIHSVVDYFKSDIQTEIKPHMRKIVTDWMLEVTEEEKCSPEVFSLAVNYMDRVLSKVNISKHQFQLLGSVCIFLASKFKESSPLCAEKLVICSDFSFTTEEIMVSLTSYQ